ncbi:MAG: helix-turn-helix domain-containing protein [Acidobacteriota bacterium]
MHRNPEQIRDPLFTAHPEFFDSHDLLQVRYEALRAHLVDGDQVARVCRRFGTSRQTFYAILEKFVEKGSSGLLPDKPGPKGPSKLSVAVLSFARAQCDRQPEVSGTALAARIGSKFGIAIHKRTIERLLGEFRSKKNL